MSLPLINCVTFAAGATLKIPHILSEGGCEINNSFNRKESVFVRLIGHISPIRKAGSRAELIL